MSDSHSNDCPMALAIAKLAWVPSLYQDMLIQAWHARTHTGVLKP